MPKHSPRPHSVQRCKNEIAGAFFRTSTEAARLRNEAARLQRHAGKLSRLAELLVIADHAGLSRVHLVALFGRRQFERMLQRGARFDDLTIIRGHLADTARRARIASMFPDFDTASDVTAYPLKARRNVRRRQREGIE